MNQFLRDAIIGLVVFAIVGCGEARAPTTQKSEDERAGVAVWVGDELLKDYDPKSTLVTKQSPIDKPKFPVIDIHCHWNLDRDPKALLAAMDDLGETRAINLSGGYGDQLRKMLSKFTSAAPERLLIFANIDFKRIDEPDFGAHMAADLEQARQLGARGLKIFKDLGLTIKDKSGRVVPIDDPRLDPIWDKCGELKLPVLIHAGDPIAFFQPIDRNNERWMQLRRHRDWNFDGPGFPTYDQVLAQQDRMIARHPRTVFISAHLSNSGEDLQRLSHWLDERPNVYVDLSGRGAELGRQPYAARKFLIQYQDRVLFGTDRCPWRPEQPLNQLLDRSSE